MLYNVYLISSGEQGEKKYKIGFTKNSVENRIKQLKTGNHNQFTIEKVFETKWGTKIESILHRNYQSNRISGEWFELSDKQVDGFINECQNLENFLTDWFKNSTFKNPKTILR